MSSTFLTLYSLLAHRRLQAVYPAYIARFYPDCVVAVANTVSSPMDQLAESSNWGDVVLLAAPVCSA